MILILSIHWIRFQGRRKQVGRRIYLMVQNHRNNLLGQDSRGGVEDFGVGCKLALEYAA